MIKINLLRNFAKSSGLGGKPTTGDFGTVISPGGGGGSSSSLGVKVVLAIVPTIGIVGYGMFATGEQEGKMDKLKQEKRAKIQEMIALKPEIDAINKFKKEKSQLERQMETIKGLSKARLQNVKALDALQNLIPKKAWLSHLEVKENSVLLEGFAKEDNIVSEFMSELRASIFFSQVKLKRTEEMRSKQGIVKAFTLLCKLENI